MCIIIVIGHSLVRTSSIRPLGLSGLGNGCSIREFCWKFTFLLEYLNGSAHKYMGFNYPLSEHSQVPMSLDMQRSTAPVKLLGSFFIMS